LYVFVTDVNLIYCLTRFGIFVVTRVGNPEPTCFEYIDTTVDMRFDQRSYRVEIHGNSV